MHLSALFHQNVQHNTEVGDQIFTCRTSEIHVTLLFIDEQWMISIKTSKSCCFSVWAYVWGDSKQWCHRRNIFSQSDFQHHTSTPAHKSLLFMPQLPISSLIQTPVTPTQPIRLQIQDSTNQVTDTDCDYYANIKALNQQLTAEQNWSTQQWHIHKTSRQTTDQYIQWSNMNNKKDCQNSCNRRLHWYSKLKKWWYKRPILMNSYFDRFLSFY